MNVTVEPCVRPKKDGFDESFEGTTREVMARLDLTNRRFGRLVALRLTRVNDRLVWVLTCDCGGTTTACAGQLNAGRRVSCGCIQDAIRKSGTLRRDKSSPRVRGLLNANGKLSEAQVLEVRRLAAEGFTPREVIETLGLNISVRYAAAVASGETHQYLEV